MATAVNDIFQVTLVGTSFNQRIMLTHFYRIESQTAPQNELVVSDELVDVIKAGGTADLETDYAACLHSGYACQEIWAQKIFPTRYRRSTEVGTEVGSAGDMETANVAGSITLHSELSGRDEVANKHIGPLVVSATLVNDGQLLPAYKGLLETFANIMTNDIVLATGAVNLQPVIYHRANVVPKFSDIVGYIVHDTVRVNRRRTVGLGI